MYDNNYRGQREIKTTAQIDKKEKICATIIILLMNDDYTWSASILVI